MPDQVDADLDALAPKTKRAKLGGKVYKLPGDMPFPLFLRIQRYQRRVDEGEDEGIMLEELAGELLKLLQVHQPTLRELPATTGIRTILGSVGALYGGGPGEAQPAKPAKRTTTRTTSAAQKRRRTSS